MADLALPCSLDAVMLVPGILGSELIDPEHDGERIWGLTPKALASALVTGRIYDRLRDPRLRPGRLLRVPGALPGLGRMDPYSALADEIRRTVRHPDAFLEYPYDWRRPVADVARELAADAADHLMRWRQNPLGSREATLTLIGHSMGGLICQRAAECHRDSLADTDLHQILTLGTPFGGSVRAVRAMASGEVLPLNWAIPRRTKQRLRSLALETESVYDLLPTYPCVGSEGSRADPATPDTLRAIGGLPELARAAFERRAALDDLTADTARRSPSIFALVGESQPTLQSFSVTAGETSFYESVDGTRWSGDGTVHFRAAYPTGGEPATGLPQDHGALAKTEEALFFVRTKLLGGKTGARQGGGVGLRAPEAVGRREPFIIRAILPRAANSNCVWTEAATGLGGTIELGPPVAYLDSDGRRDERSGIHVWSVPGLYTIRLGGVGASDITADVLVEDDL